MKKTISRFLVAVMLITQASFAQSQTSLTSLVRVYDYQLQASTLTESQKKELANKFSAEVKKLAETKSSEELVSDLNSLVAEMPEGSEKAKIQNIINVNKAEPLVALEEINELQLLNRAQAGDSANWTLTDGIQDWLYRHPGIAWGVFLIGLTAAIVYTEVKKNKKEKEMNEQIDEREEPGDDVPGFTTHFYASAQFEPSSFEECRLGSSSVEGIIAEAKARVKSLCLAQSKVDAKDCSNKPAISLYWVAENFCIAKAALEATVIRMQ